MGVPLAAQGSGHSARSPKHADLVGMSVANAHKGTPKKIKI
ncbi:MAG: hypothetical protein RML38_05700 [Bacteroidia bacterium]|nr:hypothetical protein [Bacteroidia bacterium]